MERGGGLQRTSPPLFVINSIGGAAQQKTAGKISDRVLFFMSLRVTLRSYVKPEHKQPS